MAPLLSSILKICALHLGSKTPVNKEGWEDGQVGGPYARLVPQM